MRATAAALLLLVLAVVARGGEAREGDGVSARQLLTDKVCEHSNCPALLKHECDWLPEGEPKCDYDGKKYHVKVKNCFADKKVSYVTIKHGRKCTEYPAPGDYLGFLELKCNQTITIYGYDKKNVKGDGSEPCVHKPGKCKTCKYEATYHCKPKAIPGKVCREAAGECDLEEKYDHECKCPHDEFKPYGKVCRKAAGDCDIEEKCTGHKAKCPRDEFKPYGKVCREAAGKCDIVEKCTGHKATCPKDEVKRAHTHCRRKYGPCDIADECDGISPKCEDKVADNTTVCRKAKGPCDAEEKCNGHDKKCPDDYCVHHPTKLTHETPYCPVKKMG